MIKLLGGYARVTREQRPASSNFRLFGFLRRPRDRLKFSRLVRLLVQVTSPFIEGGKNESKRQATLFRIPEQDRIAFAEILFEEFTDAAKRYPEEPAVRETAASAGRELIKESKSAGRSQVSKSLAVADELTKLAHDYPQEPYLRHELGVALQALTEYCARLQVGEIKVMALYTRLKGLAESHAAEPELRKFVANTAVTLLLPNISQHEPETLYDDLRRLSMTYPHEIALMVAMAKGTVNFIATCGALQKVERALRAYEHLGCQLGKRPSPDLRKLVAASAFNLINACYAPTGDVTSAMLRYEELHSLTQSFPDEEGVLEPYAQSMVVIMRALCRARRVEDAGQMLHQFASSMPLLRSSQLAYAEASALLIANLITEGAFGRAITLYTALASGAMKSDFDAELTRHQAIAGSLLWYSLDQAGRVKDAQSILTGLRSNETLWNHVKIENVLEGIRSAIMAAKGS